MRRSTARGWRASPGTSAREARCRPRRRHSWAWWSLALSFRRAAGHDRAEHVRDGFAVGRRHGHLRGHQLIAPGVADVDDTRGDCQNVTGADRAMVHEALLAVHDERVVETE